MVPEIRRDLSLNKFKPVWVRFWVWFIMALVGALASLFYFSYKDHNEQLASLKGAVADHERLLLHLSRYHESRQDVLDFFASTHREGGLFHSPSQESFYLIVEDDNGTPKILLDNLNQRNRDAILSELDFVSALKKIGDGRTSNFEQGASDVYVLPGKYEWAYYSYSPSLDWIVVGLVDEKTFLMSLIRRALAVLAFWAALSVLGALLAIRVDGWIYKKLTQNREELLDAYDAVRRANEAKTVFLSHVSHEIRTPLTAIMGFAQLLRKVEPDSREFPQYVDAIERNSQHLSRIIGNVLDISKIESGELDISLEICRISDEIEEAIESFEFRAKEKNIEFQVQIAPTVPKEIRTDRTHLRQILMNVLDNAFKATSKGRVSLDVTAKGDSLVISIEDTGAGVPPSDHEKIFEPFYRASYGDRYTYSEGTGLGLGLSRTLARQMGGDLILERSDINQGSRFRIILPLGQKEAARSPREQPTSSGLALKNRKILVAEDYKDSQVLLESILTAAGAEVELANNGKEAVEKSQGQSFDVVLMDIKMPVMDGVEATQMLRQQGFKVPIVAITAQATKSELERYKEFGFSSFCAKPFSESSLIQLIQGLITTPSVKI